MPPFPRREHHQNMCAGSHALMLGGSTQERIAPDTPPPHLALPLHAPTAYFWLPLPPACSNPPACDRERGLHSGLLLHEDCLSKLEGSERVFIILNTRRVAVLPLPVYRRATLSTDSMDLRLGTNLYILYQYQTLQQRHGCNFASQLQKTRTRVQWHMQK